MGVSGGPAARLRSRGGASGRSDGVEQQAVVGDGEGAVPADDPVDLEQLRGRWRVTSKCGTCQLTARSCSTTAPRRGNCVRGQASSARSASRPAASEQHGTLRGRAGRPPTGGAAPNAASSSASFSAPTCSVQSTPPGCSTRAISGGSSAPCRLRTRSKSALSQGSRRPVRDRTSMPYGSRRARATGTFGGYGSSATLPAARRGGQHLPAAGVDVQGASGLAGSGRGQGGVVPGQRVAHRSPARRVKSQPDSGSAAASASSRSTPSSALASVWVTVTQSLSARRAVALGGAGSVVQRVEHRRGHGRHDAQQQERRDEADHQRQDAADADIAAPPPRPGRDVPRGPARRAPAGSPPTRPPSPRSGRDRGRPDRAARDGRGSSRRRRRRARAR